MDTLESAASEKSPIFFWSEGVHHRLLLGAELDLFGLGGRSGFGLLFLGGRCFHRVEGQGGNSGCV